MRAPLLISLTVIAVACLCSCSPSPDEETRLVHTFQMGEKVPVKQMVYTVFERRWLPQIGLGVDARVPQNRFFLIRVGALNSGGTATIIPAISLVDDAGNTYPEVENGEGVPDFLGALRSVAPADTAMGNLVFDVPPKHYKLKMADEDGKSVAFVDVPLSFDSDAPPEVTTPLIEKDYPVKKK